MGTTHLVGGPRSSSHGDLDDLLADDHTIYALLVGRAGGQTLIGGTGASDELALQGSSDATLGVVRLKSKLQVNAVQTDAVPIDGGPNSGGIIELVESFATSTTFTLSFVANRATWDIDAGSDPSLRIIEDTSTINNKVVPGIFASFNFAHVFPTFNVAAVGAVLPSLIFGNHGCVIQSTLGIASTHRQATGVFENPTLKGTVPGDDITMPTIAGVICAPKWNVASSTNVNFGDVIGVELQSPARGFFAPNLGTKEVDTGVGVLVGDVDASLTLNERWTALESAITEASNRFMFRNTGGGRSTFGLGRVFHGTLDAEEVIEEWTGGGAQVFQIGEATSSPIGLHLNVQVLSFGDTSPTDPANQRSFFIIDPKDSTMSVGGVHRGIFGKSQAIDVNGQAVTNWDWLHLSTMPVFTLNGGSVQDVTGIRIPVMSADGATSNQAIWMEDGVRSRFDGYQNFGSSAPTQITGDQNNYAIPTGTGVRRIMRLTTDASRTITGLVATFPGVQDGDALRVFNDGGFDLVLAHENASSTAANRITTPTLTNWVIGPQESVDLYREAVSDRWVILDRLPRDSELENMLAYTIQLRNAGTTGPRADVKVSGLTAETSPDAGDLLLVELAGGELRKVDVDDLGLVTVVVQYTGSGSSGKTVTLTGINRAHAIHFQRYDTNDSTAFGISLPDGDTGAVFWRKSDGVGSDTVSLDAPAAGTAQVLTINNNTDAWNGTSLPYRLQIVGTRT